MYKIVISLDFPTWWHKTHYYDLHTDHKFYIDLDTNIIFKQLCARLFKDFSIDDIMLSDLIKDNKTALKHIKSDISNQCNYDKNVKMNNIWNNSYKKQGYVFLSRDNIFKKISQIINKHLKIQS